MSGSNNTISYFPFLGVGVGMFSAARTYTCHSPLLVSSNCLIPVPSLHSHELNHLSVHLWRVDMVSTTKHMAKVGIKMVFKT